MKKEDASDEKALALALRPALSPRVHVVPMLVLSMGDTVLAARRKGEQLRATIEAHAGVAPVVILDFTGTEAVTPSFFLGGPWSLWERTHIEQYPVLANLPEGSVDDVELVARVKRTPLWTGHWIENSYEIVHLVGDIEDADGLILSHIFQSHDVSASEMSELDRTLSITGWNNRLAGLWQRKVLSRRKVGRMYRYFLPWKDGDNG